MTVNQAKLVINFIEARLKEGYPKDEVAFELAVLYQDKDKDLKRMKKYLINGGRI